MAQTEQTWGFLTGHVVERLRKPKTTPVPDAIVRAAQRSVGDENGPIVLEHKFADDETAAAFAKLMRKAGDHTEPQTTVQVVIDPEETGDNTLVRWRAGARRGRSQAAAEPASE